MSGSCFYDVDLDSQGEGLPENLRGPGLPAGDFQAGQRDNLLPPCPGLEMALEMLQGSTPPWALSASICGQSRRQTQAPGTTGRIMPGPSHEGSGSFLLVRLVGRPIKNGCSQEDSILF